MLIVLGLIVMSIGIIIILIDGITKLHPVILAMGGVLWALGTITAAFEVAKMARGKEFPEIGR